MPARKSRDQLRFEQGEKKRAVLEVYLAEGLSRDDAVKAGFSASLYQKWRTVYPDWKLRWDAAKDKGYARQKGEIVLNAPDVGDHVPAGNTAFIRKFFPDRNEPMRHQLMLAETLQQLRPREVVLFLLWPGAGKTSVIEDYICKTLALNPDHRFRVVSSNEEHAGRMLDFCKRRFTDLDEYPEFISRFGPFYETNQERSGRPWSSKSLTVAKASGLERDRSIKASGWTGATLGSRIDTLIWDDVQTPENYELSDKIFGRLRSTYFSRGKSMRTIIIGNRCGTDDLYQQMMDNDLITRKIEVPAADSEGLPSVPEWWFDEGIVHDGGPCCQGQSKVCPRNGEILSPLEFLQMTKHVVGKDAWYSLYQQNPIHNALSTFSDALDGCLDHDRRVGKLVA